MLRNGSHVGVGYPTHCTWYSLAFFLVRWAKIFSTTYSSFVCSTTSSGSPASLPESESLLSSSSELVPSEDGADRGSLAAGDLGLRWGEGASYSGV
jgi:hypothetical protein